MSRAQLLRAAHGDVLVLRSIRARQRPTSARHCEAVGARELGAGGRPVAAEPRRGEQVAASQRVPLERMPPPAGFPSVLVVESSLRENGGLRVSLGNARRFLRTGARTTVAVIQDVDDGPLAAPDQALDVAMLTPRGSRLRHTAHLAMARLVALARRRDVVLAGSEIGNCLLLGFLAARIARRPFAVLVQSELDSALHDWVPPRLHRLTRWVLAHVDAAICVADAVVPSLLATGLPAERVHVVVNGIDVADIRARAGLPAVGSEQWSAPAPSPAGTSRERPTVIANGRLSPLKDYPDLVRAHAQVRRAGLDHQLVIMGEGEQRPEIEDTIAELGVEETVTLAGFVTEPYGRVAAADLFVLSSTSEGMPLTLLEAMALGTPIVSTRCGSGPDTLLEGGRFGELVRPGSVEALAGAIERHLRDPAPLRERARGAPQRAMAFDADRSAAAVLAVLAGLTCARTAVRRDRARG